MWSLLSDMNTRSNPLPESPAPSIARQNRPSKKRSANAKNLKASSSKKPLSKKRKGPGEGSKELHPSTTEEKHEKRQKQTTLTDFIRSSSPEDEVNTSIMTADTSSIYMDMEALELEEQRQQFLSHCGQCITMSPAANIVSVGIRRSTPSSVGSLSSVHPSSSTSQCVGSPRISYTSSLPTIWKNRWAIYTDELTASGISKYQVKDVI